MRKAFNTLLLATSGGWSLSSYTAVYSRLIQMVYLNNLGFTPALYKIDIAEATAYCPAVRRAFSGLRQFKKRRIYLRYGFETGHAFFPIYGISSLSERGRWGNHDVYAAMGLKNSSMETLALNVSP